MKDVLLIIPAYNEEGSIVHVIERVREFTQYDYLIIDDGSTDRTAELIDIHGYNHITHHSNMGLAAAIRTGMQYALKHGYRYAVQIDSDGQHDPVYVNRLVEKANEGYDIVIGSRLYGHSHFDMGFARKNGSRLIRNAIFLKTGQVITDPTSGMRLYDRKVQRFFVRNREACPEPDTIARLIRHGACVAEVPVRMHDRTAGKSYLTVRKAAGYMVRQLMNIFFEKSCKK